jgi:Xaa-Pro aminopeptidase
VSRRPVRRRRRSAAGTGCGNTGHQLGFGLHGDPLIDRDVDLPLVENMVLCLEPRIVLPDARRSAARTWRIASWLPPTGLSA